MDEWQNVLWDLRQEEETRKESSMFCEKCGAKTHRDDAMNRRCNGCEWLVHECICKTEETRPSESK